MSPEIRFGAGTLGQLGEVCSLVGIERPLLLATRRGAKHAAGLPLVGVFSGVQPHVPVETVREAAALALSLEADGLVALGGGSAIDTAKAVAAELNEAQSDSSAVRVVAVPTTYAGAEFTPFFGVLMGPGNKGGGASSASLPAAVIYDPDLTLDLPLADTVGTAMNALAHCAEAYYHPAATDRAARHADTGATAIEYALPIVVAEPSGSYGRARLLEGAMRAAQAIGASGLCLGHAMAQAVGGRYGIAQGAANAVCLPSALRFNQEAVPEAIARFGSALGSDDPAGRCAELALLGGFARLRDLGVPEDDLEALATATAARAGAKANPRPASAEQLTELFTAIW